MDRNISLSEFEFRYDRVSFQDIAGLEEVKNELKVLVIWPTPYPNRVPANSLNRKILLYGPTGSGKNLLISALATATGGDIFFIRATNVTAFNDEPEIKLAALFTELKARDRPSFLFIDNIDALTLNLQERKNFSALRFKNELMNQLYMFEAQNAYVICTTNRPWEVDLTLLRMFKRLYVRLPNVMERQLIIVNSITSKLEQDVAPFWNLIHIKTNGFTVYDLKMLFQRTLMKPAEELSRVGVWKFENEKYTPVNVTDTTVPSDLIVRCSVEELPPNSVEPRRPKMSDLCEALCEHVRSLSTQEILQFDQYFAYQDRLPLMY